MPGTVEATVQYSDSTQLCGKSAGWWHYRVLFKQGELLSLDFKRLKVVITLTNCCEEQWCNQKPHCYSSKSSCYMHNLLHSFTPRVFEKLTTNVSTSCPHRECLRMRNMKVRTFWTKNKTKINSDTNSQNSPCVIWHQLMLWTWKVDDEDRWKMLWVIHAKEHPNLSFGNPSWVCIVMSRTCHKQTSFCFLHMSKQLMFSDNIFTLSA